MPKQTEAGATGYLIPKAPHERLRDGATPYRATAAATMQYLYRERVQRFLEDVRLQRLAEILARRYEAVEGQSANDGEKTSWERSLEALAQVLAAPGLASSEIFVELWMPIGSYRADVVLTGRDLDARPAAVVVELKQWTKVEASKYHGEVWVQNASRLHPSVQVAGYVQALKHSHSAFVEGGVGIGGCAYLHNLQEKRAIARLRDPLAYGVDVTDHPIFARGDEAAFAAWLGGRLGHGDGQHAADEIAHGRRIPSAKLLDLVVQTVRSEHAWRLVGRQLMAFNRIVQAVEAAQGETDHTVLLVQGAPGTGKSVLAIQLLGYGAKKGWKVLHATGSQAFQTNLKGKTLAFSDAMHARMQGVTKKKDLPVRDMFCTFADVAKSGAAGGCLQDLVVADEAHRLWDFRKLTAPRA
jgi:hypothetical protein